MCGGRGVFVRSGIVVVWNCCLCRGFCAWWFGKTRREWNF